MTHSAQSNGFTFLEVLVALTILAMVGVGLLTMTNDSQRTLADSRRVVTATLLARQKLFELEKDGVTSITDRNGDFPDNPDLEWRARAYSTDLSGFYRLRLAVGPADSDKEYVIVEKAFIER